VVQVTVISRETNGNARRGLGTAMKNANTIISVVSCNLIIIRPIASILFCFITNTNQYFC